MSKNRLQFTDNAYIKVKAGNGGNGCVSFRREKHVSKGGPNGGNGGNGGDVYFQASSNENSLLKYKLSAQIKAENGDHGKGSSKHSPNIKPAYFLLPIGTQIFNENREELLADLDEEGKTFLAAKGGKGGYGNEHFKYAIDQAPTNFEPGEKGEECTYFLQLKVLADIGIIGKPNAGKSSLLRSISNATPEVANYPFTTINPQLGTVLRHDKTLVFADIPGLIEFASEGKGLGFEFLSHIERCSTLLHLIDINEENIVESYNMIRNELEQYDESLVQKKEIIALTKIDYKTEEEIEQINNYLQNKLPNKKILLISNVSKKGINPLLDTCFRTHLDD